VASTTTARPLASVAESSPQASATATKPVFSAAPARPFTSSVTAARPVASASVARPVASASAATATGGPINPTDSTLASTPRTAPVRATRREPPAAAEQSADAEAEPPFATEPRVSRAMARQPSSEGMALEPEGTAPDASEPWMPPNWSGSTGSLPQGVHATSRRPARAFDSKLEMELVRVRASLEEVQRERDLLQSHVHKMDGIIRTRVRDKLSRSASAPPRPSSAPGSARGNAPAPEAGRPGSASARNSPQRKRLTKDDEQEMLRRLYGKSWRPDRNKKGSGVEQLKKRLEAQEEAARAKGQLEKKKAKVYQTRAELEAAAQQMYEREKARRAKIEADVAAKLEAQVPVAKKSASTPFQRDVRLQQLSTPSRLPPRMPRPNPDERPAWFSGRMRSHRVFVDYDSARAVH